MGSDGKMLEEILGMTQEELDKKLADTSENGSVIQDISGDGADHLLSKDKVEKLADKQRFTFFVAYKTPKNHRIYKGETLTGFVSAHLPSVGEESLINMLAAQYRGDKDPDVLTFRANLLADARALFDSVIDYKPDWLGDPHDTDLVNAVIRIGREVKQRIDNFRGDLAEVLGL